VVLVGPTLATYVAGAVGELAGAGIVAAPMGFMVAVSVVSLLGERPVAARAPPRPSLGRRSSRAEPVAARRGRGGASRRGGAARRRAPPDA
jgi:hypothetical protein